MFWHCNWRRSSSTRACCSRCLGVSFSASSRSRSSCTTDGRFCRGGLRRDETPAYEGRELSLSASEALLPASLMTAFFFRALGGAVVPGIAAGGAFASCPVSVGAVSFGVDSTVSIAVPRGLPPIVPSARWVPVDSFGATFFIFLTGLLAAPCTRCSMAHSSDAGKKLRVLGSYTKLGL